jgi:hypothetical protein
MKIINAHKSKYFYITQQKLISLTFQIYMNIIYVHVHYFLSIEHYMGIEPILISCIQLMFNTSLSNIYLFIKKSFN